MKSRNRTNPNGYYRPFRGLSGTPEAITALNQASSLISNAISDLRSTSAVQTPTPVNVNAALGPAAGRGWDPRVGAGNSAGHYGDPRYVVGGSNVSRRGGVSGPSYVSQANSAILTGLDNVIQTWVSSGSLPSQQVYALNNVLALLQNSIAIVVSDPATAATNIASIIRTVGVIGPTLPAPYQAQWQTVEGALNQVLTSLQTTAAATPPTVPLPAPPTAPGAIVPGAGGVSPPPAPAPTPPSSTPPGLPPVPPPSAVPTVPIPLPIPYTGPTPTTPSSPVTVTGANPVVGGTGNTTNAAAPATNYTPYIIGGGLLIAGIVGYALTRK